MKLGNPKNTIEVIQKYDFDFQKKFGQNFLIDERVLEKIISAAEVNKQENMLTEAMGKIMAVAESYPELKANENYIKTMDSVNEYEKMVRQSRLIYNDSVTKLNRTIRMFPTSIAAGMLHITSRDYLEASEQKADMPDMK